MAKAKAQTHQTAVIFLTKYMHFDDRITSDEITGEHVICIIINFFYKLSP